MRKTSSVRPLQPHVDGVPGTPQDAGAKAGDSPKTSQRDPSRQESPQGEPAGKSAKEGAPGRRNSVCQSLEARKLGLFADIPSRFAPSVKEDSAERTWRLHCVWPWAVIGGWVITSPADTSCRVHEDPWKPPGAEPEESIESILPSLSLLLR